MSEPRVGTDELDKMMEAAKAAGEKRLEADKATKKAKCADDAATTVASEEKGIVNKDGVMKRPAGSSPAAKKTPGRKYVIEWSREQIVCDNGVEGMSGRYHTIKFKKYGGVIGAKKKAESWNATGKF